MAAPSYVTGQETTWTKSTGASKSPSAFNVTAGDIVVGVEGAESNSTSELAPMTISGGTGVTWTSQQVSGSGAANTAAYARGYTGACASTNSITPSVNRTNSTNVAYGGRFLVFSGSDGVGASAITRASGAPSLNITTTQANSAIVIIVVDWNATAPGTPTYRTNAGAYTELTKTQVSGAATFYVGYHADAGAVGTYAVGMTAPTGQAYDIIAIEIKGTAGGATGHPAIKRAGGVPYMASLTQSGARVW